MASLPVVTSGFIKDVTTDCQQGLLSTLCQQPVSIAIAAVQCKLAAYTSSFCDTTDSGLSGELMENAFAFGHEELRLRRGDFRWRCSSSVALGVSLMAALASWVFFGPLHRYTAQGGHVHRDTPPTIGRMRAASWTNTSVAPATTTTTTRRIGSQVYTIG